MTANERSSRPQHSPPPFRMAPYATTDLTENGMLLDADGNTVAMLSVPESDSLTSWGEQFANAALLCAAPEMLFALEAAEAMARGDPTPWGHDCDWCAECVRRVMVMRQKAIAAARESTRQRMERARRRSSTVEEE